MTALTEMQREAVLAYAKEHGRTWKRSLRDDWSNANARVRGQVSAELQQIRNAHGPDWLRRVSLKDLQSSRTSGDPPRTSERR